MISKFIQFNSLQSHRKSWTYFNLKTPRHLDAHDRLVCRKQMLTLWLSCRPELQYQASWRLAWLPQSPQTVHLQRAKRLNLRSAGELRTTLFYLIKRGGHASEVQINVISWCNVFFAGENATYQSIVSTLHYLWSHKLQSSEPVRKERLTVCNLGSCFVLGHNSR